MKTPRFALAALFMILASGPALAAPQTYDCGTVASKLRAGDLIFLEIDEPVYREVSRLSFGWTTHVGVVVKDPELGYLVVYESIVPKTRRTGICDFLAQATHELFAAVRLRGLPLSSQEAARLAKAARSHLGRAYDLGFDQDAKGSEYCSKFARDVFREALGEKLGRIETFGELWEDRKKRPGWEEDYYFWQAYFHGDVPKNRRTLTPISLYNAPELRTFLVNLGTNYP